MSNLDDLFLLNLFLLASVAFKLTCSIIIIEHNTIGITFPDVKRN